MACSHRGLALARLRAQLRVRAWLRQGAWRRHPSSMQQALRPRGMALLVWPWPCRLLHSPRSPLREVLRPVGPPRVPPLERVRLSLQRLLAALQPATYRQRLLVLPCFQGRQPQPRPLRAKARSDHLQGSHKDHEDHIPDEAVMANRGVSEGHVQDDQRCHKEMIEET